MRNRWKLGCWGALALLLCCVLCGAAAAEESGNLIVNPGFEKLDAYGDPAGWEVSAWYREEGYSSYRADAAFPRSGTYCAAIENYADNDARFTQIVDVEPEELYLLSGWIRAEGVSVASSWGANLSVEGLYARTRPVYDTQGQWVYVELYGETGPEQRTLTVCARVGGYSAEGAGRAWFDDLSLTKVDSVPGDTVAVLFFTTGTAWDRAGDWDDWDDLEGEDWDGDDVNEASPAWPWMIAVGVVYALAALLLSGCLLRGQGGSPSALAQEGAVERGRRRHPWWLWVGLLAALALRAAVAAMVPGYKVDIDCFRAWGDRILQTRPWGFYAEGYFCDYPPAYMLALGAVRALWHGLEGLLGNPPAWLELLCLKLPAILCDLAIALLIAREARQAGRSAGQAAALSLLVAFNPVLILVSSAWGQIDAVLLLLLLLVAILARRKRFAALMPVFVLAALVKPQALVLGPLGLLALVITWVRDRESRRSMLIGAGLSVLAAAAVIVPFSVGHEPGWLLELYSGTMSSYPYATVNAANLYYLFGENWTPLSMPADGWLCACLALVSLGWGVYSFLLNRRAGKPFFWAETALSAGFTVFFVYCAATTAPYETLGAGAVAFAVTVPLLLYLRSSRLRDLPLCGALLFLLLFTLGIKMHERYLVPAIGLLALALAWRRDGRLLVSLCLVTAALTVNVAIPLDNALTLGAEMGHLNNDTVWLASAAAVLLLAADILMLWTAGDVCVLDKPERLNGGRAILPLRSEPAPKARLPRWTADPSLHWRKLDTVLVLAVTAVYACAGLWNLGSTKAPQTAWTSSAVEETVTLDLGDNYRDFSMLYFCGVSRRDFSVAVSDDGVNWSDEYWAQMEQGECYRWKYLMPLRSSEGTERVWSSARSYDGVQKLTGRYVRITAQQINLVLKEVIFRQSEMRYWYYPDKGSEPTEVTAVEAARADTANGGWVEVTVTSGAEIPAVFVSQSGAAEGSPLQSDGRAVADEPGTCEGEPGWYNSTYFDEIYHARTAYEHLHGEAPYETTHPPLGKLLMSLCVAIFGMTPFGWRFAGCLAGIVMVPVIYVLGKQLTKRTLPAAAAAVMLSLDTMHYTQTRIATIDSFPVLFILLAFLFMLRLIQRDWCAVRDGRMVPLRTLLPDLALSGLFMGCAVASKWIGIYAGIGLAVLYFWICARQLRLASEARETAAQTGGEDAHIRAERTLGRIVQLCLWCLLFFVAVPLAIYCLSYIPYFAYAKPRSVGSFLDMVWQAQEGMLGYHSTPGLGMDHPFYSPWYEWPLSLRPMYYAMAAFMPRGMSMAIFCFGNPAVWYVGLAGLAGVFLLWLLRHRYPLEGQDGLWHPDAADLRVGTAFLLIGFAAQFLPWVLVPRGTYIYHYFASVPFLILSVAYGLGEMEGRWPKVTRTAVYVYLAVCLVFFIILFPYASGLTVPTWWLDLGKHIFHVYYG